MKKALFLTLIVGAISISFAFIKDQKPRYENLKVLPKNTTKQVMDSVMRHFSQSLGVRCTFCHVRGNDAQNNFDFASDASQHKIIARDMMKMTAKINSKYFDEGGDKNMIPEITCYSCHHGKEHPENKPPAPPARH